MSAEQDGGAAFPLHMTESGHTAGTGMSLLDYYAGQAMQGLLVGGHYVDMGVMCPDATRSMADDAYAIARHMLAARTAAPPARDGSAADGR